MKNIKKPSSLSDQAYEIIREAILKNVIKQGEPLPEEKLATQLNISKTPVKIALKKLVYDNIAEVNSNNTVSVAVMTKQMQNNIFDTMLMFEPLVYRKLEDNFTPQMLEALIDIFNIQKNNIKNKDYLAYVGLNYDFHMKAVEFVGNDYLTEIMSRVHRDYDRVLLFSDTNKEIYKNYLVSEHEQILQALIENDFVKAEQQARVHILNTKYRTAKARNFDT